MLTDVQLEKDDLLWLRGPDGCSGVPSIHLQLVFSPHRALSSSVSAAPARSGPPGPSRDGGLSADLEQKAGAPNLPDGAL